MKFIITVNYPGCQSRTFAHTSKYEDKKVVLEEIFAMFNHGSCRESEMFLKSGMRSLSVNDFVRVNTQWFQCCSVGWKEVTEEYVDQLEKEVVDHPAYNLHGGFYCLDQIMWERKTRA